MSKSKRRKPATRRRAPPVRAEAADRAMQEWAEIAARHAERFKPFLGRPLIPGSREHRRFLAVEDEHQKATAAWWRKHGAGVAPSLAREKELRRAWIAAPSEPGKERLGREWLAAVMHVDSLLCAPPPGREAGARPDDLVAVQVALRDYHASRSTLKRCREEGRLIGHRRDGAPPNSPYFYSRRDLDRLFPRKKKPLGEAR